MPARKMQCQPMNAVEPKAVRLPEPQPENPISPYARGLLKDLQRLSRRMAQVADYGIPDVLPYRLVNDLSVLVVVSRITEAAQNAMRIYSVPASFLIAKYIAIHGFNPSIKKGERFAAERLFLGEARTLATDKGLSAAMELAGSPIAYARRLYELGYFQDHFTLFDVASYIADYDLADCDDRYRRPGDPLYVSIEEAARWLSVTPDRVRWLAKTEEIPLVGFGEGRVQCRFLRLYEQRRLYREVTEAWKNSRRRPTEAVAAQDKKLIVLPVEPA